MTAIDDALGELDTIPEAPSARVTNIHSSKLVIDARKVMGEYLVHFFEGKIPGQEHAPIKHNLENPQRKVIEEMGLDLLHISPNNNYNNG